jgi:UDP-N-acetylglucosamine--N-acetylmuramyl-(pentapeptide) pyrophosphoryl-undecaprenol N-acetylglucosamine transferase
MLRAYRPDAVVGMGGYITFPVAVAARLTGIPYLLHESNTVPGLANRVCAKHAAAFALGLPFKTAPRNSHLTGTPVRTEIRTASSKPEARRRLKLDERRTTMLVFGGSQGASAINSLVSDIVVKLVSAYPDQLQVIHITGYLDEKSVMSKYTSQGKKLTWLVAPFTEDMADLYAAADFVVCRAGASTISELIALRLPALLIPYPYATDNHQESNAKFLSSAGAGLLRTQKTTTFENLRRDIETLWTEPKRRADMTAAYAKLPIPNTAPSGDALADLAESIARR